MNDLISIIVPVYKVESFLEQCIESLVNQSYRNLEIILVDDGSPDCCGEICDNWASKDSRIRVIHKQNGGLSDARNAGIEIAHGKYIAFVDSDDWIALDYYKILYDNIVKNNVKMAASGIVWVYKGDEQDIRGTKMDMKCYFAEEALSTLQNNEGFFAVAWNKLYARELFAIIRYPYGVVHEDEFVTYQIISNAEKMVLCQDAKYYYRQREGSIMSEPSCKKEVQVLDAYLQRISLFEQKYPKLYVKDKCLFCLNCYAIYQLAKKQGEQSIMQEIMRKRKLVSFSKEELKEFTFKEKIYIWGTKISLSLFSKIMQWKKLI